MDKSDWQTLVRLRINQMVDAAQKVAGHEIVCAVFDLDDARTAEWPAIAQLVADTKLTGAIPLKNGLNRRIACLPIPFEALLGALDKHEETDILRKRIRFGGSVALWAICFDGDQRFFFDCHEARTEHN